MKLEIHVYKGINTVFKRTNNLRRWTELVSDSRFDEISKQSLNCIIAFILATLSEKNGQVIHWERFPKIAIYRAFQKAYVNYDTPEINLKEICRISENGIVYNEAFPEITNKIICEKTDEDFSEYIQEGCETQEERLYKAATKIATLLELKELQKDINGSFMPKYSEVLRTMGKYSDIKGFVELSDEEGDYFKIFQIISNLRNQNRWAAFSYTVDCSVMGHLFDTAIFAYLMAIEKGFSEKVATKCFFIGIFHDIPEVFTKDIPSSIKERIKGFRKATEKYELMMMEKNFYPLIKDECVVSAIKEVMMEDEKNSVYKTLLKGADYMSGASEIMRQFAAGTRDFQFYKALLKQKAKFDKGDAEFTKLTEQLYTEMCEYVEQLNLCDF